MIANTDPPQAGTMRDAERVRQVVRVTGVGLAVNLILSAIKFAAGLVGSSQAIVADALHSLSDSVTDVAILIGARYWAKPPDDDHPHGHGRIETVMTTAIGVLLALVAVGLIANAVVTLSQRHDEAPPRLIAFVAAAISIVSKEILYRWTVRAGKRIKSSVVIANAWHHRSDGLSSVPAAAAVAGAALHPSWSFLDHIGAVVVSFFILQAAWRIAGPALGQLVDAGASEEDRARIKAIALAVDGVRLVHAIRTRHIGSGIQVDLHVKVRWDMNVRDGHEISETVKQRLIAEGPDVVDVVVHLEPFEE